MLPRRCEIDYSSVVTKTDIDCQLLISNNLKELYPRASQVGEEDDMIASNSIQDESAYRPDQIRDIAESSDFLSQASLDKLQKARYHSFVDYQH